MAVKKTDSDLEKKHLVSIKVSMVKQCKNPHLVGKVCNYAHLNANNPVYTLSKMEIFRFVQWVHKTIEHIANKTQEELRVELRKI